MNSPSRALVAFALVVVTAADVSAQSSSPIKTGDTVEAHSFVYTNPWHRAVIVSTGGSCASTTPYRVRFIGADAGDHGEPCIGASEVRALASAPAPAPQAHPGTTSTSPLNAARLKVGERVDVFAADNRDKAQRGTIVDVSGTRPKVHYDGCDASKDAYVDSRELHPAATLSADAPAIRSLIGAWKMFTPSYPTTIVRGNTVYREYGTGASAPPLRIAADGSYLWYDEYNKPPVRGRWTPDAKIDGAKFWVAFADGIVIRDSKGVDWKVYQTKASADQIERVTVKTLCSGQTLEGTRIR